MRFVSKILALIVLLAAPTFICAQNAKTKKPVPREFGPNVQAYLDYLKTELTVTDLRESQREVNPEYIRHNFNRVSALRQFALKLASESDADYVPEMEAITARELHTLFPENAPDIAALQTGNSYSVYRYLGSVRNRETFYIFARLDPYEEEALRNKNQESPAIATAPKKDAPLEDKAEIKPVVQIKQEAPRLTRERILYGTDDRPRSVLKQPNH